MRPKAAKINLNTPIQFLKGVGPKLGDILIKKDIQSVEDLLNYYPRAYEDRRAARSIKGLLPNELVSLEAQVVSVVSYAMGKSHRKIYDVSLRDATGRIHCKYFRVPYRGYFERFKSGDLVRVRGKVTLYRGVLEFHHPDLENLSRQANDTDETQDDLQDQIIPIYPESENLSNRQIQKMLKQAIAEFESELKSQKILSPEGLERLPKWIESQYKLVSRWDALKNVHLAPIEAHSEYAKFQSPYHYRIIFEEFFWLELYLASKKSHMQELKAPIIKSEFSVNTLLYDEKTKKASQSLVFKLLAQLQFQLTLAQQRVFLEIAQDLKSSHPMHRLVQGDVGCGKTMVALLSALLAIENGMQAAIMAPTEILAEQHYLNAQKLLTPLGIEIALLTGSQKQSEKQKVYTQIAESKVQLCIGTHALIQDDVHFKNLGLVIIDEQHRFGVAQRSLLKSKGRSPHFLIMTATPIPRTLAMTAYGDLDVSIIDELPKGRSPIVTRIMYENNRPKLIEFLKTHLEQGRQAYFVYPLVEESEKIDLKDAISQCERLKIDFANYKVDLLHGKMKAHEKDQIMKEFREGRTQILVSTTVIEVGVDVPNASIMVIEHAERFGLSQLHQLRGRVGRGVHKSFCILAMGKAISQESRDRVQIMEQTQDGFKISEADLEIRGPGEFLGTKQSGLPGFKMANLIRDIAILSQARQAAFELIQKDPSLIHPEHQFIKTELQKSQKQITG